MKKIDFMLRIIKEAEKYISDDFNINEKGKKGDYVTCSDAAVEKFLIGEIKKEFPEFGIVSEEFNSEKQITQNCFVMDPIDGTANFALGMPLWGIQICCIENGKTVAAAINFPKFNELFHADEKAAYLNGKKIAVAKMEKDTYPHYSVESGSRIPALTAMSKHSRAMRVFSAASISYAFVAAGRLHGTVLLTNNVWDYLPGFHIVEKAGGVIIENDRQKIAACNIEFAKLMEFETVRKD